MAKARKRKADEAKEPKRGRGRPSTYSTKIRIHAAYGTDEFLTEYHAALIGRSLFAEKTAKGRPVRQPAAKGSLRELVERYYTSRDTFLALEPSTQSVKRNLLDAVCLETVSDTDPRLIGSLPYAMISAEAIKNLRDRRPMTEGANGRLKALRGLFDWAVKERLMVRNPAKDVPYLKSKSTGFHTWTVEEIRKYEERHPIGTKARLALGLLIFTGQRRSDVASFGRQHIREPRHMPAELRALHPGRWLSFRQYKGRNRSPVDLTVPILPGLEEILAKSPCGDLTFLVTAFGKGFTHAGFGNWFRDRCNEAGLKYCSPHGVRKAGATIAAEQGATSHQLMAIFGWKKIAQAEVYTKAAEQKRMAGQVKSLVTSGTHIEQNVPPDDLVEKSGTISAKKL
jgi:integrase